MKKTHKFQLTAESDRQFLVDSCEGQDPDFERFDANMNPEFLLETWDEENLSARVKALTTPLKQT